MDLHGKQRAKPKGKADDSLVALCSYPHPMAVSCDEIP